MIVMARFVTKKLVISAKMESVLRFVMVRELLPNSAFAMPFLVLLGSIVLLINASRLVEVSQLLLGARAFAALVIFALLTFCAKLINVLKSALVATLIVIVLILKIVSLVQNVTNSRARRAALRMKQLLFQKVVCATVIPAQEDNLAAPLTA